MPRLSSGGLRFKPEPYDGIVPRDHPSVRTVNTVWDPTHFAEARGPWSVERFFFSRPKAPSVVDLPIKFPGIEEYRLPAEFGDSEFAALIKRIASVESAINPRVLDYHAYLTLDLRPVIAGSTQRSPGAHVDGFQGARISPKLPIDHSFTIVDCLPTLFHEQAFDVGGLDERFHDFFEAFQRQIDPLSATNRTYPAHTLLFMDSYAVHSASVAKEAMQRCFVRLSYSVRKFDRRGNGHNPMFDYSWEMVDRDFRAVIGK